MEYTNKEQLLFSLGSLFMVINAAEKSQALSSSHARDYREKCLTLMQQIENKQRSGSAAAHKINALIKELNYHTKESAPFPPFVIDALSTQVKGDVIAFQLFLAHEFRAQHLTGAQQLPLFDRAHHLWRDVGTTLTPKQGIEKLAHLIDKANSYLPEAEHFPYPDQTRF